MRAQIGFLLLLTCAASDASAADEALHWPADLVLIPPAGWTLTRAVDGVATVLSSPDPGDGTGARGRGIVAVVIAPLDTTRNETPAGFSARCLDDLARTATEFFPTNDRNFEGVMIGARRWQFVHYSVSIGRQTWEQKLFTTTIGSNADQVGVCVTCSSDPAHYPMYRLIFDGVIADLSTSRASLSPAR